ncbi:MAG: choline dehydrogenase [Pseudomonadota bacterium]|nr:choline dehydrogenase [Pseudomonadota bacterium]
MSAHDYIVVGAGSAGSIVAARLAEEPGASVFVLEAGPADTSVLLAMPAAAAYALRREKWTWRYETGPEPALDGRAIRHPRGRVLGGSSSINGMVFVRGAAADFDGWAEEGLTGWSHADCLPYFRRMERFEAGASAERGGDGPLHVIRQKADHPLFEAMIAAAEQAGLRYNPDYNAAWREGVHRHQANIRDGRRDSASRAYLHPAARARNGRGGIEIRTGATAHRILFDGARRAVGVVFERRGVVETAHAAREVILCAGAYESPHLLLLSGIGPADQLRAHGIPVVADLPAVGVGLEDHLGVGIGRRASRAGISPAIHAGPVGKGLIGLRWLLTGGGLGARNFWETGAFLRSDDRAARPDIQHEFLPMTGGLSGGTLQVTDGFRYSVSLMRPESRGTVSLASADPRVAPRIVSGYLTAPGDLPALMRGVRRTMEIIRQPAWDALRGPADGPDPDALDDRELAAWIRSAGGTYFHPTSTCRMGVDERSVVDAEGRVRETQGLRVVDASVMPHVVSGNTNAAVMMIAEKLSDAIRGRRPPPASRANAPPPGA